MNYVDLTFKIPFFVSAAKLIVPKFQQNTQENFTRSYFGTFMLHHFKVIRITSNDAESSLFYTHEPHNARYIVDIGSVVFSSYTRLQHQYL